MPDIPCADVAASCGDAWSMGVQVCRPFRLHAYRLFRIRLSIDSHRIFDMDYSVADIRSLEAPSPPPPNGDMCANNVGYFSYKSIF
jgi:hypothetical protein